VCRVDAPCTKPNANVLLVFTRGGLARRTRTAADGAYKLKLRRTLTLDIGIR